MSVNPSTTPSATTLGTLFIVATPIGNLGDISTRALQVLQTVDMIAAEDTRHSGRLLAQFTISVPMMAYHDHSDERRQQQLLDHLLAGKAVALISDAGTPLISDPGYGLVKAARDLGVTVVPVPGPCALIAALSVSGLPSDRFIFDGFLPAKSNARRTYLETVTQEQRTLIVYESTHRIVDALADMIAILGPQRLAVIARELTKTYETLLSGTLEQLQAQVLDDANQQRGEFVILVAGYQPEAATMDKDATDTMKILLEELPIKQAAAIGARLTGLKKRDLYQWALGERSE